MLYEIKKNRLYLSTLLFINFYTMIIVVAILMFLDPEEKSIGFDKLLHYSIFSLISFFIYFILNYQNRIWFLKKHRNLVTIVTCLIIGASVEIIQLSMPSRSTNIFDELANFLGTIFTILVIKYSPKAIKDLMKVGST